MTTGTRNSAIIISIFVVFLLWLNHSLPGISYILQMTGPMENFDPLGLSSDFLRHHAAAKQIEEGQWFFSIFDDGLNERPYIYPQPIPTVLYSILIILSGNDTLISFYAAILIFTFASWFMLAKFLKSYIEPPYHGILALLALVAANSILLAPVSDRVIVLDQVLILHRITNPLIGYPFLFAFMISLKNLVDTPAKPANWILTAFTSSILLLTYFYFWTFAAVLLALSAAYLLIRKPRDWRIRGNAGAILKTAAWSSVAAFPAVAIFLWNQYHVSQVEFLQEYLLRNAVFNSHQLFTRGTDPIHLATLFVCLIEIYLIRKLTGERKYEFLYLLFLAASICLFSNTVTGMVVQKNNWSSYLNFPFFVFTTSILFLVCLKKFGVPRFAALGAVLAISVLVTVFNGFSVHGVMARMISDKYMLIRDVTESERAVFAWLNANTNRSDTVIADVRRSPLIVAHTHNDILFVDRISRVTNAETRDRMLLLGRIMMDGTDSFALWIERNPYIWRDTDFNDRLRALQAKPLGEVVAELEKYGVKYMVAPKDTEKPAICETRTVAGDLYVCEFVWPRPGA